MADRHIHAIGREIRQTTRGGDVELDIGVARAEAAEPRHQPGGGERRRRADGQHTGVRQCPQPARRLADLAECVADRREIVLAGLGQHQRTVAAAEQLCSQPLLQSAHQLAHRTRRHRQFCRRLLHAEMAGRGLEGAQGVEGWQAGHRIRIEYLNRTRHEESFVHDRRAQHIHARNKLRIGAKDERCHRRLRRSGRRANSAQGWSVVLACFCVATFAWGFGFYGQSVFLAELHATRGWPTSLIASATTVNYLTGAVLLTLRASRHRGAGPAPAARRRHRDHGGRRDRPEPRAGALAALSLQHRDGGRLGGHHHHGDRH